jgi:hypothetical protein
MVSGMDDDPTRRSPRTVKIALVTALAAGATLVGVGVGGMAGVDRQLEAATPQQGETRVVSEGDGKRGDCPADADKPHPKQSRKL